MLRLFTLEHGVRSVMAKGALRPKSRYGGVLEPFTEGTATFYLKEGRDLHTLSGFDLLRSRQALGRSLVGFAGASLLAEIVMRTGTEEAHPRAVPRAGGRLGPGGGGARAGGGAGGLAHGGVDAGGAAGVRAAGVGVHPLRARAGRQRSPCASTRRPAGRRA